MANARARLLPSGDFQTPVPGFALWSCPGVFAFANCKGSGEKERLRKVVSRSRSWCNPTFRLELGLGSQEWELALLDFALNDDCWLDEDEQDALVLRGGLVGKEPLEERDLGENRHPLFHFDLAGNGLPADEQRSAI